MTFSEFKSLVLQNMGADGTRTAEGGTLEALRDRAMLNAMADLQRFVPVLRQHNTLYRQATDLTLTGRASTGNLPAGVRPTEWWIVAAGDGTGLAIQGAGTFAANGAYQQVTLAGQATYWEKVGDATIKITWGTPDGGSTPEYWLSQGATKLYTMNATGLTAPWGGTWVVSAGLAPVPTTLQLGGCGRYRLDRCQWEDRHDLICNKIPDSTYLFSVAPNGYSFIVHPGLTEATFLEVVYDGIKTSWANGDEMGIKWEAMHAEAVGEYASSKIVRKFDKDSWRRAGEHGAEYIRLRRSFYTDQRE